MVMIMDEIFWIVEGKLAGRRYPSTEELRKLYDSGFGVVVALEDRADIEGLAELGFEAHLFQIDDYTAPTIDQLEEFASIVRKAGASRSGGKSVLVHCKGGYGRTGTMLAGYLIKDEGYSAEEAIRFVRKQRPGAIEVPSQIEILRTYANYIRK